MNIHKRDLHEQLRLQTQILPHELKQYYNNIVDTDLPVWYPEWTVPSVLITLFDHLQEVMTFMHLLIFLF